MKQLSSSLEDYLECVYNHIKKNGSVKAVEISKKLNVSRASVTEALNKLAQIQYINYGRYENISMTNLGIKKAEEIFAKHNLLQEFFETVLKIETSESADLACKIEHIVSNNVMNKIKNFMDEYVKK